MGAVELARALTARLPWSSELLTFGGRPTDLLRGYASTQPEGAQHVDGN